MSIASTLIICVLLFLTMAASGKEQNKQNNNNKKTPTATTNGGTNKQGATNGTTKTTSSSCPKWQNVDIPNLYRSGQIGCTANADCNAGLASRTDQIPPTEACCVDFTFSYCGTPSTCNSWLKCKSTNSNSGAVPVNFDEFELDEESFVNDFRRLANCPDDATSLDDCELPPESSFMADTSTAEMPISFTFISLVALGPLIIALLG